MPQHGEMENATGHVWNAEWQEKSGKSESLMLRMFPILCL